MGTHTNFIKKTEADSPVHIIKEKNYTTKVTPINKQLIYLERKHYWEEDTTHYEVFPSDWMLYFMKPEPNQVSIVLANDTYKINQPSAMLVPPFTLVCSKISKGLMKWSAYSFDISLFDPMGQIGYLYPWSGSHKFNSVEEIRHALVKKNIGQKMPISKYLPEDSLPARAKRIIDQTFKDSYSIGTVSTALNTSSAMLARSFRRSYGLSMTQYRTKLRVMYSAFAMYKENITVTEMCYLAGFDDLARFYRSFKQEIGDKPSKYLRSRRPTVLTDEIRPTENTLGKGSI